MAEEYPNTNAAGSAPHFHVTKGRIAAKQPQALSAGARVSATLVDTTGPNSHVTGASTTPTSVPDVFDSRLAPWGTLTTFEKNGSCRWAIAQAGQAMNQTSCAGSPQAQVNVFAGCPDQTCHHRSTAGTVNKARTPRWKPSALAARTRPLRPGDRTRLRLSSEEVGAGPSVAEAS